MASENKAATGRVGGVVVSHGRLASELLAAAEMIVGSLTHVVAVSIGWHDAVDAAQAEVEAAIKRVEAKAGVLIFTDMFGGTPTNISAMFLEHGKVEVVTGVNLPMIIKFANLDSSIDLAEAARCVCEQGRSGIYQSGELLGGSSKQAAKK